MILATDVTASGCLGLPSDTLSHCEGAQGWSMTRLICRVPLFLCFGWGDAASPVLGRPAGVGVLIAKQGFLFSLTASIQCCLFALSFGKSCEGRESFLRNMKAKWNYSTGSVSTWGYEDFVGRPLASLVFFKKIKTNRYALKFFVYFFVCHVFDK